MKSGIYKITNLVNGKLYIGSVEGPRGLNDLGIRRWTCSCGAEHDRDVNAAQNIARRGLATLAEGASA